MVLVAEKYGVANGVSGRCFLVNHWQQKNAVTLEEGMGNRSHVGQECGRFLL